MRERRKSLRIITILLLITFTFQQASYAAIPCERHQLRPDPNIDFYNLAPNAGRDAADAAHQLESEEAARALLLRLAIDLRQQQPTLTVEALYEAAGGERWIADSGVERTRLDEIAEAVIAEAGGEGRDALPVSIVDRQTGRVKVGTGTTVASSKIIVGEGGLKLGRRAFDDRRKKPTIDTTTEVLKRALSVLAEYGDENIVKDVITEIEEGTGEIPVEFVDDHDVLMDIYPASCDNQQEGRRIIRIDIDVARGLGRSIEYQNGLTVLMAVGLLHEFYHAVGLDEEEALLRTLDFCEFLRERDSARYDDLIAVLGHRDIDHGNEFRGFVLEGVERTGWARRLVARRQVAREEFRRRGGVNAAAALPGALTTCFAQAEGLKESTPALTAAGAAVEQDRLTDVIKNTVVVPGLWPYEEAGAKQMPIEDVDLSSYGKRGVLVVGADGYIGRRHLAALPTALSHCKGELQLLGGLDRNPPSAETIELFRDTNPGMQPVFFTDIEGALESARREHGLDPSQIVVVIATPNETHLPLVRQLADLGVKEFVVEKPLADTLAETDKIIASAGRRGLKVVGAGQVFTSDVVERVREVIAEKGFRPKQCLASWQKDRTARSLAGENMEDPNIFLFDLFHELGLVDMFGEVEGIEYAYSEDMELPEHNRVFRDHGLGVAFVKHEGGMQSVCYISFIEEGQGYPNRKIVNIVGEDGSVIAFDIAADDSCAETVVYVSPEGEVEIYPIKENTTTMLAKAQTQLLYDVVTGTERSPTSTAFHRRMEKLIEQAMALAESNRGAVATRALDEEGISLRDKELITQDLVAANAIANRYVREYEHIIWRYLTSAINKGLGSEAHVEITDARVLYGSDNRIDGIVLDFKPRNVARTTGDGQPKRGPPRTYTATYVKDVSNDPLDKVEPGRTIFRQTRAFTRNDKFMVAAKRAEEGPMTFFFDIGGVILDTHFRRATQRFEEYSDMTEQEMFDAIIDSRTFWDFHAGRATQKQVFKELRRICHLQKRLTDEELLSIWNDISEPIDEMVECVRILRSLGHRVCIVTDSNPIHHEHLLRTFPVLREVDGYVDSSEVGRIKRDGPGIFLLAANKMGVSPEGRLFVDDKRDIVRIAEKTGMKGHVFHSLGGLMRGLEDLMPERAREVRAIRARLEAALGRQPAVTAAMISPGSRRMIEWACPRMPTTTFTIEGYIRMVSHIKGVPPDSGRAALSRKAAAPNIRRYTTRVQEGIGERRMAEGTQTTFYSYAAKVAETAETDQGEFCRITSELKDNVENAAIEGERDALVNIQKFKAETGRRLADNMYARMGAAQKKDKPRVVIVTPDVNFYEQGEDDLKQMRANADVRKNVRRASRLLRERYGSEEPIVEIMSPTMSLDKYKEGASCKNTVFVVDRRCYDNFKRRVARNGINARMFGYENRLAGVEEAAEAGGSLFIPIEALVNIGVAMLNLPEEEMRQDVAMNDPYFIYIVNQLGLITGEPIALDSDQISRLITQIYNNRLMIMLPVEEKIDWDGINELNKHAYDMLDRAA